jgi:hypothetical protein
MKMVSLATGQIEETPNTIGGVDMPSRDTLLAHGYRDIPILPEVADGCERGPVSYIDGDGVTAQAVYRDTLIQDRLDMETAEAAHAAYQASLPVPMPTGIESPVVVLTDADGKGWGVVADGGDLVTYPDHASPRPDAATIAARIHAARATNALLRADLVTVRTNTAQNITDCQNLVATNFSAGGQRQTINGIEAELVDVNRQLQALRKIIAQHLRSEP